VFEEENGYSKIVYAKPLHKSSVPTAFFVVGQSSAVIGILFVVFLLVLYVLFMQTNQQTQTLQRYSKRVVFRPHIRKEVDLTQNKKQSYT